MTTLEIERRRGQTAEAIRLAASRFVLNRVLKDAQLRAICRTTGTTVVAGQGATQFGIEIADPGVLWKIATNPDPGAGDLYMDGKWEMTAGDLGAFLTMMARNYQALLSGPGRALWSWALRKPLSAQDWNADDSRRNAQHHYDIGDDLYAAMLDEGMNYSCAFFADPTMSLRAAQENKLRTTIRRLDIRPGMRVLDIGCGWGEASRLIAAETGAAVDGITLAENQLDTARERAGAGVRVPRYFLSDYREHAGRHVGEYDRILSIGMFEHVGETNYRTYFAAVHRQLAESGKALIHSIVNASNPAQGTLNSVWLERHIFPGGRIPDLSEMLAAAAAEGLEPVASPYLQPSSDYARTLRSWRENFLANGHSLDLRRYDARFRRMWIYYLALCEAMFDGCGFQVAQIVFQKRRA